MSQGQPYPFPRTCRQFISGSYQQQNKGSTYETYMDHPNFAQNPRDQIRAYSLILKDLQELFDYIEPAYQNFNCYSYRIHALLLRTCVEIEANLKVILQENIFSKQYNWNIKDYEKIEVTHQVSQYKIYVPDLEKNSNGNEIRQPFKKWQNRSSQQRSLPWYQAYNNTKHNRHTKFEEATFEHLIDACCGLLVVLSAQFETKTFSPNAPTLVFGGGNNSSWDDGIGRYFRVKFPDFPQNKRYNFNWQYLEQQPNPFDQIDYDNIWI